MRHWQQKRNEMHISDDMQHDWLQMQTLLDENMPVSNPPASNILPNQSIFRLGYILFASLAVVLIAYLLWHKNIIKHQPERQKKNEEITNPKNNIRTKPSNNGDINFNNRSGDNSNDKTSLSKKQPIHNNEAVTNKDTRLTNTSKNGGHELIAGQIKPHAKQTANAIDKSTRNTEASTSNKNTGDNRISHKRSGHSGSAHLTPINPIINNATSTSKRNNYEDLKKKSRRGSNDKLTKTQSNSHHNDLKNRLRSGGRIGTHNGIDLNNLLASQSQKKQISTAEKQVSAENVKQGSRTTKETYEAFIQAFPPTMIFNQDLMRQPGIVNVTVPIKLDQKQPDAKLSDSKTKQDAKAKVTSISKFEYGVLAASNTSADLLNGIYPGIYVTYNFNDKWGLGSRVVVLSPQMLSGSYSHANASKVDSNQRLQISDSRKVYFTNIPVHLQYKVTNTISLLGGPFFSIPMKQTNGNSILTPDKIRTDTIYYPKLRALLNNTQYQQGLNFGVSAGVTLYFNRFSFEATYLQGLKGTTITSGLGGYTSNSGMLQFSVGFRLNKGKR